MVWIDGPGGQMALGATCMSLPKVCQGQDNESTAQR